VDKTGMKSISADLSGTQWLPALPSGAQHSSENAQQNLAELNIA
jgi:hypothetical protein